MRSKAVVLLCVELLDEAVRWRDNAIAKRVAAGQPLRARPGIIDSLRHIPQGTPAALAPEIRGPVAELGEPLRMGLLPRVEMGKRQSPDSWAPPRLAPRVARNPPRKCSTTAS